MDRLGARNLCTTSQLAGRRPRTAIVVVNAGTAETGIFHARLRICAFVNSSIQPNCRHLKGAEAVVVEPSDAYDRLRRDYSGYRPAVTPSLQLSCSGTRGSEAGQDAME